MITNNEYNILMAIWKAGHALTAKEIVEYIEDKSFKDRTIHSILTAMLEKGLIYVDGQKLSSRIYSRCFNTRLSFEEYHSEQIKESAVYKRDRVGVLPGIFSALIDDDDINSDTLDKLEELIEEKKRKLNG